ncbi:MAG: porin [Proteobacteria bacterium]|nr:porin [Pseudomonadota bacterium]
MNKKILAVAIASAMAAPFAMADEGSVTISGNVGAAVTSIKNNDDTRASDVDAGGSDLSISGSENIGNGLKAVFVLKSWLNVTGNADQPPASSLLFGNNKDAFVGLAGNFGTIALGAHGQPYKTATGGLELFGDTIGDARGSVTNGQGSFHSGIGDAVIWFLPNMNGFSGHVQIGSENNTNNGAQKRGAQFNYSNGPLYMTYAYADDDATANETGNKFGVGYGFGDTKINVVAERTKVQDGTAISAYSVGLAHKFGANTAKIQFASNDSGAADVSIWAVGLDHALSKRTGLYAVYADGDNLASTEMDNGLEVGIGHSF